jgi:ATP-binding cassette, subfamily C, bacterial
MSIHLKDNRISSIIKLTRQAFGRYKWQIIVLVALGFLSGMLEGIGIGALIPMFSFIVGEGSESNDFISQNIEKFFDLFHIAFNLRYLLVFIVLLFVFKAIVTLIFNYIRIKIDTDYELTTRSDLFKSSLGARWSYLLKQKIGYLETVLMTDVVKGSLILRQISNVIMVTTGLIMYTLVAINISLEITLVTLALGGVFFLMFKPLMYKTRKYAARTTTANKEVSHYVNEKIVGMKTVKSMHIGEEIVRRGKDYFYELKDLKMMTFFFSTFSSTLVQPISLIFIVIVFAVSYKMPMFNFAAFAAVVYLIQRIFQYIQSLQSNMHQISDAVPYLKAVLDYQQEADEMREKFNIGEPFRFKKSLSFKNVEFSYHENQPILKDISFDIEKGEMVGLIGQSGSGKTTIVDLMLRLFNIEKGEILLDGKNIDDIGLKQWRGSIGYVSQDVFLLNATISDNIRFFDKTITNNDITKAAKMANIYDFVQSSPEGFNTVVGERGIVLSAGQRQRVSIARVLARNPQLLILDEATSALDNESEAKIQQVIENLRHKVTVLVVAHRLSTVMNVDKLIAIESGKIIEEGKPKDLLAKKESYFHRLANLKK